jgi:hypothetical protein
MPYERQPWHESSRLLATWWSQPHLLETLPYSFSCVSFQFVVGSRTKSDTFFVMVMEEGDANVQALGRCTVVEHGDRTF